MSIRILIITSILVAGQVGFLSTAWGQADDEIDLLLGGDHTDQEAPSPSLDDLKAQAASEEGLPEIGEDQLAHFVLDRGFYITGDLGMFLSFAGQRAHSNVQPHVAIRAGYDFSNMFSVEGVLGTSYVSQNPVPYSATRDFGLITFGAQGVVAFRPTDRFAIEPKLGAGMALLSPGPTAETYDLVPSSSSFAGYGLVGVDLKYLTLLTDFTAGLALDGYFILGPNIPAVSASLAVRYTFS